MLDFLNYVYTVLYVSSRRYATQNCSSDKVHYDVVDLKDCTYINKELVIIELLNLLDFPTVTTHAWNLCRLCNFKGNLERISQGGRAESYIPKDM